MSEINIDTRFVVFLLWGVGTVLVYLIVLYKRRRAYARVLARNDRRRGELARALQDLISAFALFLTALCSFLAITAIFFGPIGTGARGFLVAIALGSFFAAGLVKATSKDLDTA